MNKEFRNMRSKLILALVVIGVMFSVASAQQVYTNDRVDYTFDLPSPTWKLISEPGETSQHAEFVYGDRLDGYLQIRREVVDAGLTPGELAQRDQDLTLRFLPGFIQGKQDPFNGRLNGVTMSYEFVKTGKPMLGRIYYLQVDARTVYTLRFSGLKDKLARIRNQTDVIARTFKMK
jgi:hypothetical protein